MDENANKDQPVTITAPPNPPVTVDPQNPLPEPSFFWRRWIAIIISANMLVFSWFAAAWLVGGEQWDYLYYLNRWMIGFAAMVLTYYFIAPSAAELTSMIQSASIIKKSLGIAGEAVKDAIPGPQTGQSARFPKPDTPDSRIPAKTPGGAPGASSGDLGNSDEVDAAPRGRT
jgi:hypothetical protein